jgi:hypothetical protein
MTALRTDACQSVGRMNVMYSAVALSGLSRQKQSTTPHSVAK